MTEEAWFGVGIVLFYLVMVMVVVGFQILVGGWCAKYSLEKWATFAQNKPVQVSWLIAGLLGLFFSYITIPLALITWIYFLLAKDS